MPPRLCSGEGKRKSTGRQGGEVSDDAVVWRGCGREKPLRGKGAVVTPTRWRGELAVGRIEAGEAATCYRPAAASHPSGEVEERTPRLGKETNQRVRGDLV